MGKLADLRFGSKADIRCKRLMSAMCQKRPSICVCAFLFAPRGSGSLRTPAMSANIAGEEKLQLQGSQLPLQSYITHLGSQC
jgi:hypothetical protein